MTGQQFKSTILALILFSTPSWAIEEPLNPKSIRKLKGFEVELLRVAEAGEDSWISMSFDDRDRVILGLDKVGVARLTLFPNQKAKFERIESTLKHCRGVLFAHDCIYVNSTDSKVLVRMSDRDQDDKYETSEKLISFDYRSRYGHGANQMRLGPEKKIYVVVGNDVSFPANTVETSPYLNPQNDWLLPEQRDLGHDSRVGYILRIDPDGKNREVIAGGFRNPVDMDFDPNGEMFTFDADMEWDIGAPWYRPIRVNHIVSGGDYGWRWNTGKWPAYYPDSLPSNLDVGMGSPTGVTFGTQSNFPLRYRQALFIADWQNGKIFAAFPKHQGASYQFEYESFLDGAPLNVCDMEFGRDGKLYFITGGRGSQSALYRVSWTGKKSEATSFPPLNPLHVRRVRLEAFHQKPDSRAIEFAWNDLGHADPWIRNAARIAIEKQDVSKWERRVFDETNLAIASQSLLALVRMKKTTKTGRSNFRVKVVRRILELIRKSEAESRAISDRRLIELSRVCGILFARHGPPGELAAESVFRRFRPYFPSQKESVDQELCKLLIFVGSRMAKPNEKSPVANKEWLDFKDTAFAELLNQNRSQESQIHLARSLAHLSHPWPESHLDSYVKWFSQANGFRGGHLLPKTIIQMKTDFETAIEASNTNDQIKKKITSSLLNIQSKSETPRIAESRDLVKTWGLDDLKGINPSDGDVKRGKKVFIQAQCASCHRKTDVGSMIGPDLTNVAGRFSQGALLESILIPSRQIDPKYALSTYATVDGKTHTGRVHGVNAKTLTLEIDPILQTTITIKRDDIESTRPAKTSPMPSDLLNYFTKNEINDLLAFLLNR